MTIQSSPRLPKEATTDRLRPGPLWWVLAVPAIGVAGYAITLQDVRSVADAVPGLPWLDEVHFVFGGLALLVGIFAFRRDLLVRHVELHKKLGKVYCTSVFLSGFAGLAMAVWSMGGMRAHLGFGLLAIVWLVTTGAGLLAIKRGDVASHRRWMVRSYAGCFAAVTLRVELPVYIMLFGRFDPAYQLVSWTAWIPNLLAAEWWLRNSTMAGVRRRSRSTSAPTPGAP